MRRLLLLIASLASLVIMSAPVVPSVAAVNAPRIPVKQGTSLNWSGYDVPASASPVTYVSGTWDVPTVTATSTNAYSSIWVGIDGDGSNTVEQIGTEQDWINGRASYSVWYEMYPKFPVTIPMSISPGDTFTASVRFQPKNSFVLTITNVTKNQTYTTTQKSPSANLASAEWIVEAPWSGGVLPLADFGSVNFSACTATIGGTPGDIGSFTSNQSMDMVNSSGTLKDHTSKLSGGGASFSVTYVSSN